MYCSESGRVPQSYPKALDWLRKAGFQRIQEALMLLLSTVILAKATLYDGKPDIVGYSALPEAPFWAELYWAKSLMTKTTMNTTFLWFTVNAAAPTVPTW
jgi:hypothetical protein